MTRVPNAAKAVVLLLSAAMQVQSAPVKEIRIESMGPAPADAGFVRAHISLTEGQEPDAVSISKDVRNLLKTNRFSDVRVEVEDSDGGPVLVYLVRNKLRLSKPVKVTGARHLRTGKILDLLKIKPDDFVDEATLAASGQNVAKKYREDGYPDVKLEWSLETVDEQAGTATASLRVHEGRRLVVGKITFSGNKSVPSRVLRRAIDDSAWWNPIGRLKRRGYDADKLEAARQAVLRVYLSRGFLDAEVGAPRMIEKRPGKCVVDLTVTEGIIYRLGSVSFSGVKLFPESELAKSVKMKPGNPVSMQEVENTTQDLRTYYTSRGYLRTGVKRTLNCRKPGEKGDGVADIAFSVSEGSLTHIRNIFVRGNTVTMEKVIRRELTVYPGEVFDERQIHRSEARLKNLGYFARVSSRPEATPKLDEYDLAFEVEEQRTGTFMIGGGFSSIENFVGFVEVTEGNFDITSWPPKGAGQKIKLRGQSGSRTTAAELSFVEPWFLGRRLSLGLDLYSRETDYIDYEVTRRGGAVDIGKSLENRFFNRMDLKYQLEDADIGEADTNEYVRVDASGDAVPAAIPEPFFESVHELKSSLALSLIRETRDSFFFPSRGNRVVLTGNVSGGLLGGDSDALGWEIKAEQYFPLWYGHVFDLRGRAEVIDGYGGYEIPLYDRLFIGGGRTIRGFEYRDVGPKVKREIEGTGQEVYRVIGGKTLVMASAEYVLPVFEKIRLAAFLDCGNVNEEAFDFAFDRQATSAGIELRFDIPQFPVRISYASILEKDSEATEEQNWGFWIGSGF